METNQLVDKLTCFGMTRQEAAVYLCLVQNGEITGYEAAKQTGISRSNAYNALAGLVDKGAAYTAEGAAVLYYAVDAEEFCSNKIRNLEEMKSLIQAGMPKVKNDAKGYLTITGDRHIKDKLNHMLFSASERIYLSMTEHILQMFRKEIEAAVTAGKKVVVITDASIELKGVTVYQTEEKGNQIGVITDSSFVLTGEMGQSEESTCLYTGQQNFVQVFKDSLRNEIKLIQLMKGDTQ